MFDLIDWVLEWYPLILLALGIVLIPAVIIGIWEHIERRNSGLGDYYDKFDG